MDFKGWLTEDEIVGTTLANQYRQALGVMPKSKQKHSVRVTRQVHDLFGGNPLDPDQWTAVNAAIFHDFLERGGDHSVLQKLGLQPQTIQAIEALTSDKNDSDPLEHLQSILPRLDEKLRNIVILIKISDRIDNLSSRSPNVGRNYLARSSVLVNWLFKQYTGNPEYLFILRKRLREFGVRARKRNIAQPQHWR